jgi:hypothetical protein
MITNKTPIILASIALVMAIGCSSHQANPVMPTDSDSPLELSQDNSFLPVQEVDYEETNRIIQGTWTINFDVESLTATVTQNRLLNSHWNATTLIPAPIITVNSWEPITEIIDVDVAIHNPYLIAVNDVRLIIYTDAAGHMLWNNDNFTALYDIPGGEIINPFIAYAKDEPYREFGGTTWHQENLQVLCPGGNFSVQFAIDASFPGNCEEPYKIRGFSHGHLYDEPGESTTAIISVYDWQDDVNSVQLYCPEIFGATLMSFSKFGSLGKWSGEIINNTGASIGSYLGYLFAKSENSGNVALYKPVMISVIDNPLHFSWARTWGGTDTDKGMCTAVDDFGNLYVFGSFMDVVDFDPGSGVDEHSSNGLEDIFLSKFDSNGDFVWARTWGGIDEDNTDPRDDYFPQRGIITDTSGNVYVTGNFRDVVDFDPGPGIDEHTSVGGTDIFLSKFDSSGDFIWARTWGGPYWNPDNLFEGGYDLAIDYSENIFVTGTFRDTVDFDPGSGIDEHTSNGYCDVFLSKFDTSGNFIWALTWGGIWSDFGYGVATDSSGNVFASGQFRKTVDFDPSNDGIDMHTAIGSKDAYFSKFDWNGSFIWARTWGGSSSTNSFEVVTDDFGNIYVGGGYHNCTVDFDPGPGVVEYTANGCYDPYLSKFDSNGDFLWVRTWGSDSQDHVVGLATDGFEHIYLGLRFSSGTEPTDFDPGPGVDWHDPGRCGCHAAMSCFDLNGDYNWARTWCSDEGEGLDYAYGIATDDLGNVFITGTFCGTGDFDPGPDVDEHVSNGEGDTFLSKFMP